MKAIEATTCTDAWLQGCDYLLGHEADNWRSYNMILEINNPMGLSPEDKRVVEILDRFLTDHGGMPFNTVVNTIFPAQLYARHGSVGVYEKYLAEIYPQIKEHPDCSWGTYAHRILCRTDSDGSTMYPLRELVDKLKVQLSQSGPNRAVYEVGVIDLFADIPIYDPREDRTRPIGGPCLSHISFHLSANRKLMLTALYRSHWYVQRALGNLFGLAHLQHFVASEAGLSIGTLTCVSAMAQLDVQAKKWGKNAVRDLIGRCHAAQSPAAA
jgi:hypothetical protein